MPLFVPLDVDYMSDPKIMRLKDPLSELLYVRALCFAKRTLSDGFIHDAQIGLLCTGFGRDVARPGRMVDRLVRDLDACGLWRRVQDGYEIVAWSKRNVSAATVKEASARRRLAGQKANHDRWHVDGKTSSDCPFCVRIPIRSGSESDPIRSESDSTETETETETESGTSRDLDTGQTDINDGGLSRLVQDALTLATNAEIAGRDITRPIDNRERWTLGYRTNKLNERQVELQAWLDRNPTGSARQLAIDVFGANPLYVPFDEAAS